MMLVRWTLVVLLLTCGTSSKLSASIFIDPPIQVVELGDVVEIGIAITGLGELSPPSLGAFDLDIAFDPGILAFSSITYGDPILGDQLDLFGLGSLTGTTPGLGVVNIFELSFDLPGDLETLQAGSFALATLTFNAIGAGTSTVTPSVNALADALGASLSMPVATGSVTVTSDPAIPEPSSALVWSCVVMFGLGSTAMRRPAWLRRRNR